MFVLFGEPVMCVDVPRAIGQIGNLRCVAI